MADIDIVPKPRSYLWLWIVIALAVLTVIWFAASGATRPPRASLIVPGSRAVAFHQVGSSA